MFYQMMVPKEYRSSAELFIERHDSGKPNSPLRASGLSASLPTTQAAILKSTDVLKRAMLLPGVAESEMLRGSDEPVMTLRKMLETDADEEEETFTVGLQAHDPEEAAIVLNAVVQAYLQSQRPGMEIEAGSPIGDADSGFRTALADQMSADRLMQLSRELAAAQLAARDAADRLRQAEIDPQNVTRMNQLLNEAGIDTQLMGLREMNYLQFQLSRLNTTLNSMPSGWGPDHHQRAPVEREAGSIRAELQTLRDVTTQGMITLLNDEAKRTADREAELLETLDQQQSLASAQTPLPIKVIEWAKINRKPVSPQVVKTMAVATVLGLFCGIGLATYFEVRAGQAMPSHAAETLPAPATPAARQVTVAPARSEAQADAPPMNLLEQSVVEAGTPVLGVVPQVPSGRRLTSPNFEASASSIHQVRAVLEIRARQDKNAAYAFTSPRRGAGKTSVAIGVATSLAMSGTKTLVVDCDLAGRIARGQTGSPVESQDFGPIDTQGSSPENDSLDDIAMSEGYIDDADTTELTSQQNLQRRGVAGMLDGGALDKCVIEATVPGLWLLPATHAETRHIGALSDAFIRRLIDEATHDYDLILFDTGPIPGSVEALLVCGQADGVVLVLPENETPAHTSQTMAYLKVIQAKVLGTVFNSPAANRESTANPQQSQAAEANANFKEQMVSEQDEDLSDDAFLQSDRAAGSGVLAAAVFSDQETNERSDWTPDADEVKQAHDKKPDTVFAPSVDDLFASANQAVENSSKSS